MSRAFTVENFFQLYHPTNRVPLHLSPDGQKLAITIQSSRRTADSGDDDSFTTAGVPRGMVSSRVLIVDTVTGAAQEPFPSNATSWAAQWSPDGTRLAAYVQDEEAACLGVWERASGKRMLYPHVVVRPFFGFEVPRWTTDGQTLVVKVLATQVATRRGDTEPSKKKEPGPATVFTFSPDIKPDQDTALLAGWADGYLCNLAQVDVKTGEVKQLAENWRVIGWKVAPGARSVAVLRYTENDAKRQQLFFDLIILSLDEDQPQVRTIARRIPQNYGICFNWSPDSQSLAYLTQERGVKSGLFVVPAEGSTDPRALHDAEQELALVGEVEPPRWSEDGQRVYCLTRRGCWEFAADGSTRRHITVAVNGNIIGWVQPPTTETLWTPLPEKLLYLTRNARTKDTGLLLGDIKGGESTSLMECARRTGWLPFAVEASGDGAAVYLLLEASNHPAEIWQCSGDFHQPRRLYALNADLKVPLGTSRLLEYRTLDGKLRRAALLLPPGYTEGSMLPLVVEIYGGSMGSSYVHSFGGSQGVLHSQLLASHGYAVLYPDVPLTDRDPLKQLPGHVIPAINHLVDLGIADPQRVGLIGQSYGGYCTLALLTQTTIFAAAVASAGFYNLISEYLTLTKEGNDNWLGWAETGQGRMSGTPWEKRDSYIENSPIFYLDRVQTPVLLVCGSRDSNPPAESEAVFVGLRRLGRKAELRIYKDEDHWSGRWSERSYRDLCERVLAWFDEHLST